MDRIFFENVRCFSSREEVPLAPLTVLVGENSSGKSTFLALLRLAWDLASKPASPDFNEEPFQLGAFDQIVSAVGPRSRRKSFTLGMEYRIDAEGRRELARVAGRFVPHRSQPVLDTWSWECAPYELRASLAAEGKRFASVKAASGSGELVGEITVPPNRAVDLWASLVINRQIPDANLAGHITTADLRLLGGKLMKLSASLGPRPYAFAPVRTKPKRTYDPVQALESPEGSHIPMILANISQRDSEMWTKVVGAVESFGQKSGLFGGVEIRRLGKLDSDPFQIQVQIGSNAINLLDVGYGVSQVLPIVVDCLRGERGGSFLLQQPEVHLHPKAQAELGSFLGTLAKEQDKRFVIETHSDYLVDRIRMDIRDGKGITPRDVSLLYFERKNGKARIHSLELDEHGNILNPPPGYRSFFLQEERRFLGA